MEAQPLASSDWLSLGLGPFLLAYNKGAGARGEGEEEMAQGRQGQAGLGQSQGASLCLVLGLPSPPQVQREQGEGAGIQPSSPFPHSESSAWHRGSQAGQLQLQPRNPERLAWGRITWVVGALPAPPPPPPQAATQPALLLLSCSASGHQAGPSRSPGCHGKGALLSSSLA